MTNKKTKGTNKEHQCLQEFKAYMAGKPDYKYVAEWRVVSNRFQNQDFLGNFDLAVAYRFKSIIGLYLIQVKSRFEPKYYKELQARWLDFNCHCYLAVYDKSWKGIVKGPIRGISTEIITLPGFRLVRI